MVSELHQVLVLHEPHEFNVLWAKGLLPIDEAIYEPTESSEAELMGYSQKAMAVKGKSQKAQTRHRSLTLPQVHCHLCHSNGNLRLFNIPREFAGARIDEEVTGVSDQPHPATVPLTAVIA